MMVIVGAMFTVVNMLIAAVVCQVMGGTPGEVYIAAIAAGALMEVVWVRLNIFRG